MDCSWAFTLDATGRHLLPAASPGPRRLPPRWVVVLFPTLLELIHFLMEIKMLRTVAGQASR
jgi:hypothetical protein